jgi:hypothetical protein
MNKQLIFIFLLIFSSTQLYSAEESLRDSQQMIHEPVYVNEDPGLRKEYDKSEENRDEEAFSYFIRLKNEVTAFSKANHINEFYVFPFLAGLLLGPIFISCVFLFNQQHPERLKKVKTAFFGWLWWLIVFSVILII